MTTSPAMTENRNGANRIVALVLGIVFVLVGILGFFDDPILGVFGTNTLHNLVHLLSGIVLLFVWWYAAGAYARVTNIVLGIVYLLVALLGFVNVLVPTLLNSNGDAISHADDGLHLVLGIVLVGAALLDRTPMTRERTMPAR